ncbi:hydrogenase maturation protease [Rhizorhapis sp. SPR117]|uniref:hydrogenase maturation protease n=1 Tax=Rhizorhapis sp. SPR117 TaxID=2912611 RepID=UPI001F3C33F1|nr:hydrogenase maturation protease [Rhizorhapis sp. SPR117]
MSNAASRRIVLGIGNPDRGDDAVGRKVARLLRQMAPDDVEVAEHDGEATALLARLDGAAAAYLVDACQSGAPAGTVHRFDVSAAALPQSLFGLSTHGFGLAEAVELARALGQLPARCIVYAIEGECFDLGMPLSPATSAAVAKVVRCLGSEIIDDMEPGREPRCTKPT